jgi:hypothetical protein
MSDDLRNEMDASVSADDAPATEDTLMDDGSDIGDNTPDSQGTLMNNESETSDSPTTDSPSLESHIRDTREILDNNAEVRIISAVIALYFTLSPDAPLASRS